jgi:hypothetical protein
VCALEREDGRPADAMLYVVAAAVGERRRERLTLEVARLIVLS